MGIKCCVKKHLPVLNVKNTNCNEGPGLFKSIIWYLKFLKHFI